MLVKYKTILYGEKPYVKKAIDGKALFDSNKAADYKIISHDFCCDKMGYCIQGGSNFCFSDWNFPEPCYSVYIPDTYGDGDNEEIHFCPFCGEKIEYKEVERSRYKKVKSFDYVEEEIKGENNE